jgi:membrane protein implicated in regulation of membrane protease activity
MKWIADAARELVALFVDDGSLAIAVLAWVVVAVLAFPALPVDGNWLAIALFAGLAFILTENVLRAARRRTHR